MSKLKADDTPYKRRAPQGHAFLHLAPAVAQAMSPIMLRSFNKYKLLFALLIVIGLSAGCSRRTPAHKRALALGGEVMREYQKGLRCPSELAVEKMAAKTGGLCVAKDDCLQYMVVDNKEGEQCGLAVVVAGKAGDIVLVPSSVWTTVELIEASAKREAEKAVK